MVSREKYFESVNCKNIKEILYYTANKYNKKTAFIVKNKNNKGVTYKNISYKELLKEVNKLGTGFFNLGLKGKRVAIVGRNRYEWVLAHLANLLGGIVSIPLDKELPLEELESCIKRSKADALVFDEKYTDVIEEIKQRNNTNVTQYICMSKNKDYLDLQTIKKKGKELIDKGKTEYIDYKIDNDKMAILLFTSGTTAKSKAVMLSNYNIASNVYSMLLVEDVRATDNNLAFLPFHHVFGSTCIIVMLAAGATTAFPDGLRYVAQNLREYEISVFVGVPLLMEALYRNIEKEIDKKGKTKSVKFAKKLSNFLRFFHIDIRRKLFKDVIDGLGGSLRYVISGGAPLNKFTAQGFNEFGIQVVQGYGLTETSPVIAAENSKRKKYGSIGFPMENVEFEIVNKDKDGIGEIRVKGPNVMLGYYEDEERTNEVLKDGWFYTGDLAYIDKKGYIFLAGRDKDMIVLKNGKKVFPEEIEEMIDKLDVVDESIVYGMKDENDPTNIKLAVKVVYNKDFVNKNYKELNDEELYNKVWEQIKQVNKSFPPYKYIKSMTLTDVPLIKTTTHKIKRNEELKLINK